MASSPLFWIITAIFVVLATIFIVWLKKYFRVQKIKFNTGIVETELERKKVEEGEAKVSNSSINISGNTMVGRNKISVQRKKTNVTKNYMRGENEIEVGDKPRPKSKGKKNK